VKPRPCVQLFQHGRCAHLSRGQQLRPRRDITGPKAEGNGRSDDLAALAAELAVRAQRPADEAEEPDNQRPENQRPEINAQRINVQARHRRRDRARRCPSLRPLSRRHPIRRSRRSVSDPVSGRFRAATATDAGSPQIPQPAAVHPPAAPSVATASEPEGERPTPSPPMARPVPPSRPSEGAAPAPRPRARRLSRSRAPE